MPHDRREGPPQPPGSDSPGGTNTEPETTLELLYQAKRGDAEALDRLCRRYGPRLRRWARGRLPRWARQELDTDDLVQEALVETLKRLDTFEPRHEKALQAYLCQSVHNRIHDEVRKARRSLTQMPTQAEPADATPSPLEAAVGREALRRYDEALRRLDPDSRDAILLRVEMGCSYEEVAAALSKPSPDAARMAVRRAVLRLAKEIGGGGDGL